MSNPIVHGLEVAGKDIVKVVEFPFTKTAEFIKVLGDGMKQTPAVKQAVIDLVQAGEKIVGDAGSDIAAKGLNLVTDLQTIADVQAFFKLFSSEFLPVVETAYSQLDTDTKG